MFLFKIINNLIILNQISEDSSMCKKNHVMKHNILYKYIFIGILNLNKMYFITLPLQLYFN